MSLSIGIVGLPNVGKSTLFNALTRAGALASNYPFATIEPNVGVVGVPDPRLAELAKLYDSARIVPATVRFTDIAGLVRGASQGQGLGNQFLAHIRETDAICQVVRVFADPDVTHVDGDVSPERDIETVVTELILADLQTLDRALPRLAKETKLAKDPARAETADAAAKAQQLLDQGTTLWDGTEHKLSFTPTANIPSQLQQTADPANGYSGGLSAVTVDGQPMAMSQSGDIAANLQLRDVTLPAYGRQLDQMAGNTIAAFQTADPTVTSGQTGIFTANGAAVDPSNAAAVPGLAASIAVNASVDPTQGGQAWRMRDGAQATTQSTATGDNSTVLSFVQAMNTSQTYDTTTGLPGSMTLTDAASQTAGLPQSALSNWTANNTSRTTQAQSAQTALSNATGVNVDTELQRLLTVQATYAATTQVIQAAAKMLDELNTLSVG